jgi:F-type H+-transporting ATPase subunit gamma
MQLIATSRFQKAYARATASKPYSEKLAEVVGDLARAGVGFDHPLMRSPEVEDRSAQLIITSSRGLCGGYNTNVLRAAVEHLDAKTEAGVETAVTLVRKKAVSYFRFKGRTYADSIIDIGDMPRFDEVEPLAERLIDRFVRGEIASAYVSYMRFLSVATQKPETVQLLPLAWETEEEGDEGAKAVPQYEFSPPPEELLAELLPATVRLRLYQAFTDAAVSEQVARMVAMKSATTAAEDKIRDLTLEYNRARQTHITMELLDIVGGAAALE